MDQDVGSSVITHIFANTPALYAWGLKQTTANFQVIYIQTAAQEAPKRFRQKYKKIDLKHIITLFLQFQAHSLEYQAGGL